MRLDRLDYVSPFRGLQAGRRRLLTEEDHRLAQELSDVLLNGVEEMLNERD